LLFSVKDFYFLEKEKFKVEKLIERSKMSKILEYYFLVS